jgi:HSP20 family protein
MLLRFDPFRDLDSFFEPSRTPPMIAPYEAVRRGDHVLIRFDLPGVDLDAIDLTVERSTLTLEVQRHNDRAEGDAVLAGGLPAGSIRRSLSLGENLDTEHLSASYDRGVLEVRIPVAEQAKARRVPIGNGREALETTAS